ncbi:MAG: hypothetical protein JKY30_10015 [Flavobacteriales bacterium]|nr:hypothetical protein [Flavobacteriales bacterium]
MKKTLLISSILLLLINQTYSQVVSGGSQVQAATTKPGDLAGSSFNGNVNLSTGTYSGSYTLGSVATPGGLKYDVNMAYSSAYTGGDNVPIATGIPYGVGWSVVVPTISISVADYKSYTDDVLKQGIINLNSSSSTGIDNSKNFSRDGNLYWFSPIVNIPGVASGRAVFKFLDKETEAPVFVLENFEQYIELMFWGNTWEVSLPDGTKYFFGGGSISYRKGYNKRTHKYDELFNDKLVTQLLDGSYVNNPGASEQFNQPGNVSNNIKPKGETMNWHCTQIRNRNLPHQFINFSYDGYGEFNYFKDFLLSRKIG